MAETRDFLALDWVKGEIEETLKQAQQALEAFVENPEDQTRLRFCLTYLHQVYGTLQMVEFYGAALLAEEMEHLVQAMMGGKVSRMADAQETLMRGMLQLPVYLDRIKASRRDLPVVLMPLLNDLRAARGEKLLSEGALFKPDMSKAAGTGEVSQAVAADPHLAELLRKVRQMYQLALLGFIRGENLPTNIGYMQKVAAKMEKVSGDAAIAPLWKVAGAVVEGLAHASIDANTAVKLLLGHVDRQLKVLVEQGAAAFAEKPPEDLLKNLLFYVARSTGQTPLVVQVRQTYKLDEALPSEEAIDAERAKLSGPDRQTMASVAGAISEELTRVKDALDIFMRGGEHSKIADLAPHLPTLKQVADTIAMLGLGPQRKAVLEQHDLLKGIVEAGRLENPAVLMDIAGALLYVEATLTAPEDATGVALPSSPEEALTQDEIRKAREAVIRECRLGLEGSKEKIVEYIASQWDPSHIREVPEALTAVRGGLHVISLDRAARVLQRAVDFINAELLVEGAKPDWQRMDTLADAISSVEYLLERMTDDPQSGDHILEIAEKSVADLGFAVDVPAPAVQESVAVAEMPAAAEMEVLPEPEPEPMPELLAPDVQEESFATLPEEDFVAELVPVEIDEDAIPVVELDDEPLPLAAEAEEAIEATPTLDVEHHGAAMDEYAEAPVLEAELSDELDLVPTQDVPMTAAAEQKHSFVDDEIPLVDEGMLSLGEMIAEEQATEDVEAGTIALYDQDEGLGEVDDALADVAEVEQAPRVVADFVTEAGPIAEPQPEMVAEEDEAAEAVAPAPVVAAAAPPAVAEAGGDDDGEAEEASVDEEIVEIFVEEIAEVMEKLDEFFPQWVANQQDEESLKEFRRAFHTLKGSGRMVGAKYVGELAWSVENMLNRVIDKTVTPTPVMIDLIRTVKGIVPELVEAFAKRKKPPYVVEPLMACAEAFAKGETPAGVPALVKRGAKPVAIQPVAVEPVAVEPVEHVEAEVVAVDAPAETDVASAFDADEITGIHPALPVDSPREGFDTEEVTGIRLAGDTLAGEEIVGEEIIGEEIVEPAFPEVFDADTAGETHLGGELGDDLLPADVPEAMEPVLGEPVAEPVPAEAVAEYDPVLLEVFSTESAQHLAAIDEYLAGIDPDLPHHPITDELLRAMHTLKGSARMAGIMAVADIAGPTEKFCKELRNDGEQADVDIIALVREAASLIRLRVEHLLPDPYAPIPGAHAYLELLEGLLQARQEASAAARREELAAAAPVSGPVQPRPGLINDLLAEGLDHVLDGADYAATWSQQGVVADDLDAIRLELRKLAAAAERGGIVPMFAVAQKLRRIYNGLHDGQLMLASNVLNGLQQGHEAIIAMMDCMAAHQSIWPATEAEALLDELSPGLPPVDEPGAAGLTDATADVEEILFSEDEMAAAEAEVIEATGTVEPDDEYADVELSAEAVAEAEAEVIDLTGTVEPEVVNETVVAATTWPEAVPEEPVAEAAVPGPFDAEAETVIRLASAPAPVDDEIVEVDAVSLSLLEDEAGGLADEIPVEASIDIVPPAPPVVAAPVAAAPSAQPVPPVSVIAADDEDEVDEAPDRDPELVEIFLEEAGEIVESAGESLETWISSPENLIEVQKLQRDLHTLKGGARMAEIPALGDLAHELENLYEGLSHGTLSAQPSLYALLRRCHDRIAEMVDDIRARGTSKRARDLIALIHDYIRDPAGFTGEIAAAAPAPVAAVVEAVAVEPAAPGEVELPQAASAPEVAPVAESATPEPVVAAPVVQAPPPAPAPAPAPVMEEPGPAVDPEILGIFIEEAGDLTAELDDALAAWRTEPSNAAHADQLKRVLHTLKGGARLAGLKRLGDLSHTFESRIIDLGPHAPDEAFFASANVMYDEIGALVERVRAGGAAAASAANAEAARAVQAQAAAAVPAAPVPAATPESPAPVAPAARDHAPVAAPEVPVAPAMPLAPAGSHRDASRQVQAAAARQAQPQEMVKVPSDLLEKLVNLAGETSINRGRIETQVTDFRFTLNDMASTISRLAEQLRRLNAEADETVKANWEKGRAEGKYSGDFDPLEMDQYSGLHQLTKQLFESASDLLDIRDTMVGKVRDTETLLLQQSRVNTELQEGLMRSRMVPFSRLIPRLRRIVRQVAGELKKNIEIEFINPEGEMDRTLLERIVAPLEHMLRNACDHGVELPDVRKAAGKNPQGHIRLSLSREGGEVVLTISDDGKGVNVAAVRKKAMERGLMDANSKLTDQEVMQFILEAGFSTAEKVTQISGRGVGMDVVSSEIKQMGGALMIHSEPGQGTTFVIRLPFTVSVNRALMVRVGDEQYAIPLVQIEGIVRVSPYELDAYYQPGAPPFEYAGTSYRMNYLGSYMHGVAAPDLQSVAMPLPVLLVRGSEHTVAIQVDQLIGSREVVVKAVGPQLSTVAGISGATILGDGRVVIILDLLSLVRAAHLQHEMLLAQQRRATLQAEQAAAMPVAGAATRVREVPLIMVTDDSVTVRKVTGRFLERQGFEVVTAKDGMDAVAQLADVRPDLMLLDIEMPRMDGFEVAMHCRHDSRLKDLPIIMITSRTGEKHRERAKEIGVNAYLGKPFQENELLATIQGLLAEQRTKALQ